MRTYPSIRAAASLILAVSLFHALPVSGQEPVDRGEELMIESYRGVPRDATELLPFAGGTIDVAFNETPDGMVYTLGVKAPNVIEARLEQPGTGQTYVEIVAEGSRGVPMRSKSIGASIGVDADYLEGQFSVLIPGAAPKNASLILVTPDGHEVLWILTTESGLDGKEISLVFSHGLGSSQPCHTYTLNCSGGCSTSKECCTILVCLDCVNCEITCGTSCRT